MNDSLTRTEFDKAVDRVLSRPDYVHLKGGIQDFFESLKETIGRWLREALEKVFYSLPSSSSVPKNMATVFLIIGLVVFLAIVVLVAVKASRTFSGKPAVREILGEKIDAGTTTDSLREKASAYMKNGEYRMAVRYEYIALLLFMHEKNVIFLDETKTNEEIAAYLEKNDFKPLSVFRNLDRLFNASWYGHKALQETVYEKWRNDSNLIWNRIREIEEKGK